MEEKVKINKKKHKKEKSKFWFGYRIYVIVLVVLITIMCFAVWRTMKKYEAAQPDKVIEKVIKKLQKGDMSQLVKPDDKENKFEKLPDVETEFKSAINGHDITYRLSSGSYDSLAPVYDILSDDKVVATVELKSVKEYKKMAIFVLSEWEVLGVEPVVAKGNKSYTITAPSTYEVKVNGVVLSNDEKKGDEKDIPELKFASEYVDVPKYVTYEITGLREEAEITVNGRVIDKSDIKKVSDDKYSFNAEFIQSVIPTELSEYVLKAAKTYSNYFSKDVEGYNISVAPIAMYFPEGSYYLEMAENYRRNDMWTFSTHYPAEIYNEKVDEYTVYNDNCFSVRVSFNKKMLLKATGQEVYDDNDQIYYYVKIGDKWLIADMREKVK